jgi:hypothetical protein
VEGRRRAQSCAHVFLDDRAEARARQATSSSR